jgi:UDP-4-amino-4,6-dideoxy-N-acetyl-beta-L-altrosamine transaminase
MIPYGRQSISQLDIDCVLDVLRADFLTQGPKVPEFEVAVAKYVGAPYAVAVNSATSALHIACLALELGENDWLWTSPNSFVASANCALYCGAKVDFVDIDPQTYNLCPNLLAEKLFQAKKSGKLPKVVIPVHFAGQSCDMHAISSLSKEYGFKVIEDASHAIGGCWLDEFIGGCQHSDISVFSFHPVKIITTAEGGMLTTRDEYIAGRLADLRSHGITRDRYRLKKKNAESWYYEQQSLGFNFRMTDLQAALGISQLTRLDEFVCRRHELVARYNQAFKDLPLVKPWQHPSSYSAFHLYVVQVCNDSAIDRNSLINALRDAGISPNVHYIPIHLQPYYTDMGFKEGDFPTSEAYYRSALSLPLHTNLTDSEQTHIIETISHLVSGTKC